jgi:hypothetical protein
MKSTLLFLFLIFGTLAVYGQDATNLVSDTQLASDPGTCKLGQHYFNTTLISERICTNPPSTWGSLGLGGGNLSGSGVPSNTLCTQAGLGYVNSLNGDFYTCPVAAGTWILVSGGSAPAAFNQVTAGTNAGNALFVGNGSLLSFSGSGLINANMLGGAVLSSLATGILKNTTGTGVPLIAVAGTDYQVPGNYITALTGDLTAAGPGSAVGTLKNTGTPGTYMKIAFDAQGRETAGFTAACADLSNASPSCSIDATNGSNISSGSLALARITAIANNTLLGNNAGSVGSPIALTATQATALLNTFTTGLQGLVPASGGGTVNFLRADGTFSAPPGGAGLTSIAADNLLANFTGSSAVPVANLVPSCANDGAHALVFVAHVLTCEVISASGSGTVATGVATHIPIYAASTAAVSSDSLLTDNGTTLTYTGPSGITSTHGFTATPDGVHPGVTQLYGNTTLPALGSNLVNLIGPSSATFTAYGLQFSGTGPAGAGVMLVGAPTSAVSQLSFGLVSSAVVDGTIVTTVGGDGRYASLNPASGINLYTAGIKNIFVPSATTAGARNTCGAVPSALAAGDVICSAAGNFADYDGTNIDVPTFVAGSGATIPSAPVAGLAYFAGSTFALTTGNAHSIAVARRCADSSGSGTAQSCTTSPSFIPTAGDELIYTTTTANTGALTLSVNSGAAAAVQKWAGSAVLVAGDIPINKPILMVFDAAGHWDVSDVGNAPAFNYNAVTFSATPTFTFGAGANTFKITLTGNVTSSTVASSSAGQPATWVICQDGTGSRTFAWPANFFGAITIGTTASKCNTQSFTTDGTNFYASSLGVINQ